MLGPDEDPSQRRDRRRVGRLRLAAIAAALTAGLAPSMAAASDDEGVEYWLDQSASWSVAERTTLELETAQRLRSASDGREDTYYARLWLNREVNDDLTLAAGVERRSNQPGADETRLLQQASLSRGLFRGRLRLEQRFVDGGQAGVRLRPRVGVAVPLGDSERWTIGADAEAFLTLRSTTAGGDTGLTGVRTTVALAYEASERLSLRLGYVRDEDFNRNAPDTVAHAPLVEVELSF